MSMYEESGETVPPVKLDERIRLTWNIMFSNEEVQAEVLDLRSAMHVRAALATYAGADYASLRAYDVLSGEEITKLNGS